MPRFRVARLRAVTKRVTCAVVSSNDFNRTYLQHAGVRKKSDGKINWVREVRRGVSGVRVRLLLLPDAGRQGTRMQINNHLSI